MEKIRFGLIGCGSMGREHIENIRALRSGTITALSDPHAPSIAAAQALLDTPAAVFADHRALLESGLCDAVIIASPNFTHAAILSDVLDTELHVLAEKPLVTSVADGWSLVQKSRLRKKGIAWVAQEYRYMPPVAEMIRLAHQGVAGTLHQVAIREHREPFYPK